jgi:hypothetical protein
MSCLRKDMSFSHRTSSSPPWLSWEETTGTTRRTAQSARPEALEDIYTLLRRDCVCERRDQGCAEFTDDKDESERIPPGLAQDRLFCSPHARRKERPRKEPHKANCNGMPRAPI